MDRQGSDFLNVNKQVKEMLGSNAVPIVFQLVKKWILKEL